MPNHSAKGVALFIVLTIIMVVVTLTVAILRIMSSQARLTHHQISRIRAYYAVRAGVNLTFDRLRTGSWTQNPTSTVYYCVNNKVDAAVTCANTFVDASLPNIQIAIHPAGGSGISGCSKLEVKTSYTYTP